MLLLSVSILAYYFIIFIIIIIIIIFTNWANSNWLPAVVVTLPYLFKFCVLLSLLLFIHLLLLVLLFAFLCGEANH